MEMVCYNNINIYYKIIYGLSICAKVDDVVRRGTAKTHITGNQNVICQGRNVRLMIVLLT